jgi:hypothetical protein
MKCLPNLFLLTIFTSNAISADCSSAVSNRITNSGNFSESDRARLMDDCNKFQDYRL